MADFSPAALIWASAWLCRDFGSTGPTLAFPQLLEHLDFSQFESIGLGGTCIYGS